MPWNDVDRRLKNIAHVLIVYGIILAFSLGLFCLYHARMNHIEDKVKLNSERISGNAIMADQALNTAEACRRR